MTSLNYLKSFSFQGWKVKYRSILWFQSDSIYATLSFGDSVFIHSIKLKQLSIGGVNSGVVTYFKLGYSNDGISFVHSPDYQFELANFDQQYVQELKMECRFLRLYLTMTNDVSNKIETGIIIEDIMGSRLTNDVTTTGKELDLKISKKNYF
jgi:hypothetical protein